MTTTTASCCTAVACLVVGGSAVVAAGLRSPPASHSAGGEEGVFVPAPPAAASFPLVVRTRHASVTEADDVLLSLNLDVMGRGRHLDGLTSSHNDVAAEHPQHAYTYERDVLLHSPEDWSILHQAVGDSFEIDQEHTELFHFRGNDKEQHVVNPQKASTTKESDRHLGSTIALPDVYESMPFFPCYRTVQGTYDSMYDLQMKHPHLATVETIGTSFKGEPILMLKVTGPESAASPIADREPAVFTSGVHAREYAPPEIATRMAEYLIDQYGTDADITAILDHTVLHFVLQSNPDSRRIAEQNYAQSQPRKNQRNVDGCSSKNEWGTDLNRNFDFQHGSPGASNSPCHILYHGKNGASEGETKAIQNLSKRVFPEWQRKLDAETKAFEAAPDTARGLYVDIHSYGRDIIFPYGYQNKEVGNIEAFKSMSHKICSINGYDPSGSGYYFLGRTSGDTLDYHYGALGVASILYEVGNSWAESCSAFESYVFPSNLEALLYTTKLAMTPYRTSLGPDVMSMDVAVSADGNQITVNAEVSDYAMTELPQKARLSTAVQTIQSVKAYLDSHPYDASPSQPLLMTPDGGGSFKSHTESVSLTIDSSAIDGRHTVCLMASDTDGYDGTVSCKYVDIPVKADAAPTPTQEQEQSNEPINEEQMSTNNNNTIAAIEIETDDNKPTNETDTIIATNVTDTAAVATNQTIPIAPRENDMCPNISNEEACTKAGICRWRENKNKCVGICQGRKSEQQCLKNSMCQWDANLPKCSRK